MDRPLSKKSAGKIRRRMGVSTIKASLAIVKANLNFIRKMKRSLKKLQRPFLNKLIEGFVVRAVFRLETSSNDTDQIDQCPNAACTKSQQLNNTLPGITQVEPVDPKCSYEGA